MLKAYGVEELREGMKVGRDILDGDNSVLIGKGNVLSTKMIESLLDRPIFSVYIDLPDAMEEKEIPGKEFLLDDSYVNRYELLYSRLQHVYTKVLDTGKLDEDELFAITDKDLPPLLSGAKAVSRVRERAGIESCADHCAVA